MLPSLWEGRRLADGEGRMMMVVRLENGSFADKSPLRRLGSDSPKGRVT